MIDEQEKMSEMESLKVISTMIEKVKTSYHERGTTSILWGVVITICSLTTWAQIHFGFDLEFDIWLLTLAAVVPTVILAIRENKRRKVKTYDQTAMDAVWTCFGIGIFITVHASNAVGDSFGQLKDMIEQTGQPRPAIYFSDLSSAYMLMLYGIPTLVTAAIKNFKPMLIGGIVCWVSAIAVVYTSREVDMLLMAVSAIAGWLIPGLILKRISRPKSSNAHV
jgi:hypothetical protein